MCLLTTRQTPLVAANPIRVYKVLEVMPPQLSCRTPFRHFDIAFDEEGKCELKAEIEGQKFSTGVFVVQSGIHSFRKQWAAEELTKDIAPSIHMGRHSKAKVFYAIIPTGSEYYLGEDEDIVANHMIIFKRHDLMRDYMNKQDITHRKYDTGR